MDGIVGCKYCKREIQTFVTISVIRVEWQFAAFSSHRVHNAGGLYLLWGRGSACVGWINDMACSANSLCVGNCIEWWMNLDHRSEVTNSPYWQSAEYWLNINDMGWRARLRPPTSWPWGGGWHGEEHGVGVMWWAVVNNMASSLNSVGKVGEGTPRLDKWLWCACVW